jgi:glycosyltransferase involved in cell wall biosynthesis
MRVLVISPLFPPVADSEAICGGKFVQGLIHSGVETSVIFSSDMRNSLLTDKSARWAAMQRVSVDIRSNSVGSLAERCWSSIRYQSTSWARWTRSVVLKANELHRQKPFDLIISRSLPHHAHLAGYWVASGLGIPWIAVVNDPWDLSPFALERWRREWKPNLNWRIWWRRVMARVDRLCFPCERLRDFCVQDSDRTRGLLVVPHIGGVSKLARHVDRFVIVHAGKLGVLEPTGRSAVALLEGLRELFRIRPEAKSWTRLLFVGAEDPDTMQYVAAQGLSDHVACTGFVSYEESLDYIAQAALCVLVEGDVREGVFLPSKLCDYIAARKPVLALSPDIGTVADLAAEGGVRRIKPKDPAAVAAALVELFDAFLESRLDSYAPSNGIVRRFEGNRIIDDFLASVTPLTGKPHPVSAVQ